MRKLSIIVISIMICMAAWSKAAIAEESILLEEKVWQSTHPFNLMQDLREILQGKHKAYGTLLHQSVRNSSFFSAVFTAATIMKLYDFAVSNGAKIAEPLEIMDSRGIELARPVYGELNIVIRKGELSPELKNYASVAIRTYNRGTEFIEGDRYESDVQLLKRGKFNYSMLLANEKAVSQSTGAIWEKEMDERLYIHYLLPNHSLLLDQDKQQLFAYIAVFFDEFGQVIGYLKDSLPPIEEKLVPNPVIAALMYHHFSTKEESLNTVTVHPDRFKEQLKLLKEKGYTPIRQQDLIAFMKGGETVRLPEKSVLITIDDGYESNYEWAFPAIVEEKFYATIFNVTVNLNKNTKYSTRIKWPQAREMVHSGRVLMQSHTHKMHEYGAGLSQEKIAAATAPIVIDGVLESMAQFRERAKADLLTAKQMLELETYNQVFTFAYPYGKYSDELIELLLETGHEAMYTVEEGVIRKGMDMAKLPRINVEGYYDAEKLLRVIEKYAKS